MLLLDYFRQIRRTSGRFTVFVLVTAALYICQLIFRVELTPLGYFSLYSNFTPDAAYYEQILPVGKDDGIPLNIYSTDGSGFLMHEILPTRYQVLKGSDHCNQMNHKLQRIGLSDENTADCERLKNFRQWYAGYAHRHGMPDSGKWELKVCGFKNGKLLNMHEPD